MSLLLAHHDKYGASDKGVAEGNSVVLSPSRTPFFFLLNAGIQRTRGEEKGTRNSRDALFASVRCKQHTRERGEDFIRNYLKHGSDTC